MEEAAARVLIAVPKPPAPPTGDRLIVWVSLMALCLAASAVLAVKIRRTKEYC